LVEGGRESEEENEKNLIWDFGLVSVVEAEEVNGKSKAGKFREIQNGTPFRYSELPLMR